MYCRGGNLPPAAYRSLGRTDKTVSPPDVPVVWYRSTAWVVFETWRAADCRPYDKIVHKYRKIGVSIVVLCPENTKNVVRYRRGGASRSESKSIDCRGQSHHNSIGNLPPAALRPPSRINKTVSLRMCRWGGTVQPHGLYSKRGGRQIAAPTDTPEGRYHSTAQVIFGTWRAAAATCGPHRCCKCQNQNPPG